MVCVCWWMEQVVFRSCKLIPTMVIAGVINKRSFTTAEYAAALAVCFGLIVFAAADMKLSPSFSPWGLVLVSLSVVCDAVLPNLQERLFVQGSSRLVGGGEGQAGSQPRRHRRPHQSGAAVTAGHSPPSLPVW